MPCRRYPVRRAPRCDRGSPPLGEDLSGRGSTPERSGSQAMVQQGQTIELARRGSNGERLWAYRYRTGGRDSKRIQRGGFASEQDARGALERELERLRRERRIVRRLTLAELVEAYPEQHDVQPVTIEKLRYLLSKATAVFGDRRIGEDLARDRRVADDPFARLPLRGNPGAAASPPPGSGLGA
jgi:hypothetical protein